MMFFRQPPILKHNLPVENLGLLPPPKGDLIFEMKTLPTTLKYVYLDEKKIYHVIISSDLSGIDEDNLLTMIQKH